MVNRVVRSTSVPIAELPNPTMRSPSQWPGTARSAASAPPPAAGPGPIGRLDRTLADQDLGRDAGLAPFAAARPRHPQGPPGAQAGGQLAAQRPAALHVQRLVDSLVADPHGLILGEVEPQAAGDLLRAPRPGPPAGAPTPLPAALSGPDPPPHRRPSPPTHPPHPPLPPPT